MHKISVIITSYNQKEYLKEAIESVLRQTLRPFEIIICDDASSDGSSDLISSYQKKYSDLIQPVFQKGNVGISKNRSAGLQRLGGNLVTWLDGDDRFKPKKLEEEMALLQSDQCVKWVYSQVDLIDPQGRKFGVRYKSPPSGYILDTLVTMLGRAPRNQLVYYDAIKKIGFFRDDMDLYEDFELCLRLAKNYKALYCPQSLVEYRIHSGGLSKNKREAHRKNLEILYNSFIDISSDLQEQERKNLIRKLEKGINSINFFLMRKIDKIFFQRSLERIKTFFFKHK